MPYAVLNVTAIVFFVAIWATAFVTYPRNGRTLESPNFVRALAIVWMATLLIPYFCLGPLSYIHLDDEGELVLAFHKLIASEPASSQYTHRLASGVDLRGSFMVGGEVFSINRFLLSALPLWLGILAHKTIAYAAGFIGAYLLVRRGMKCQRFTAVGFAALFTVAHYRFVFVTFDIGWSLLPLAAYVVAFRTKRRWYFRSVATFAALAATFSSPYQSLLPMAATFLGAALIAHPRWLKFIAGAIITFAAILANWSESIFAMLQLSPASILGQSALSGPSATLGDMTASIMLTLGSRPVVAGMLALSFIVALWRRKYILDVAFAFLVPAACFVCFNLFPWPSFGIGSVKGVTSGYFMIAWIPLSILIAARCIEEIPKTNRRWRGQRLSQLPVAATLALAAGTLGHFTAIGFHGYFNSSGQAVYRNVANLRDRSWEPSAPFRIAAFADRNHVPRPNIPTTFYGLDSFDGWLNITPAAHSNYWSAVNRHKKDHWNAISAWPSAIEIPWSWQGRISLSLLAIANVRFLVSPIPVSGPGIALIDGPDRIPIPYRQMAFKTFDEKIEFYGWFFRKFFQSWKVYIYEIDGVLPRVFAAARIVIVDDTLGTVPYHDKIEALASKRTVVLRRTDARRLGFDHDHDALYPQSIGFKLIDDGFAVDWGGGGAGVLVINAAHQRFFKAYVDGRETAIVPANGIQMAIAIPKGANSVRIEYRRPTLFSGHRRP